MKIKVRALRGIIRNILLEGVQDDINQFISGMSELETPTEKYEYVSSKLGGAFGQGSSRLAYELGDRVLKIAINEAGVAQNKVEANVANQEALKPWVVKVFNRDPEYHWILVEKVTNDPAVVLIAWYDVMGAAPWLIATMLKDFKTYVELMGMNFDEAWDKATRRRQEVGAAIGRPIVEDLIRKLYQLGIGDVNITNAGVTGDGRPVLLDTGYDEGVQQIYGLDGLGGLGGEALKHFTDYEEGEYERRMKGEASPKEEPQEYEGWGDVSF